MPHARWPLRALILLGVATGLVIPATAVSAAPSVDEVQGQIRRASIEFEKIVEDYNKVNEHLKASRAQAAAVQERLGPLRAQLDAARSTVSQLAARAYKTREMSAVNALLDSGSAGALVDRIAILDRVSHAEQRQIDAVTSTARAVTDEKSRLDAIAATQIRQQQDLATRKSRIEKDLRALYELRKQAYGAAQEAAAAAREAAKPKPPAVSGRGGTAVKFAYAQLGKPYVWAADGPGSYDCSGLTLASWRAAGVQLPHNAAMQWGVVAHLGRTSLAPGDLVFYSDLGHVALYIGNNQVIHAPQAGEVVKIASMDMMRPYGYGRPG